MVRLRMNAGNLRRSRAAFGPMARIETNILRAISNECD
jgi:hypothetical protein